MAELAGAGSRCDVRETDSEILGIGVEPMIGVGQRALLLKTPAGNVLWDPPPFLDETALQAVRDAGGLSFVTSSHPHMYGAIVEWSRLLDAQMVLPEADLRWLMRPHPGVRTWEGTLRLLDEATLVQCGGHFPGSAVLHWAAGAGGRGVLFAGDTMFVTPGKDRVTFAWSAPNKLPLSEPAVRGILAALAPYSFERIYSGWWDAVIEQDAKCVLEQSAKRYIQLLYDTPSA